MEIELGGEPRGPCAGVRVLDLSTVISGPHCTQMLGDMGADVVKIEPPTGDPSRYSGGSCPEPSFSPFFVQFNRNKRSVALDLKSEAGRAVARRLADSADVLIENFRPGVAERLGFSYEELRRTNRGLVYVAISGFGRDGPYAELPAYDHVIQGLTGLMPTQGEAGAPRLVQGGVADKSTALTALAAITAALFARERGGGEGQRIDVPMLDAYAAFALPESMTAHCFPSLEFDGPSIGDFFRTWETADGFVVGLVIQDAQYLGLCSAVGREDLANDERFRGIGERFANYEAMVEIFTAEIRNWPTAEFIKHARAAGAPFAPANSLEDFLADPQVAHSETVVATEDPRIGTTQYLRHPVRYTATPASLRRHAPRLGEHSDEILAEAGFTPAEIAELRASGALK